MTVTGRFVMIFSASADLLNSRGMIIPRALHKSADAEKITIKLLVTDIYISNFSQTTTQQTSREFRRKKIVNRLVIA